MALLDQRSPARYAVVFCAAEEASTPGALVVEEDRLLLEGRGRDGLFELTIPYSDLAGVRIGRIADERLNGRPTLLLERRQRPVVQVVPFGPGLLQELAHLLAALVGRESGDRDQVAVVVPLRAGCLERAQELVRQGPPFDPAALGLTRHDVFLTPGEAIFVFAGPDARAKVQQATRDSRLWRVGIAWRDCIGGRPYLTSTAEVPLSPAQQPAYSWTAAHD
jgi:hypothetical protein